MGYKAKKKLIDGREYRVVGTTVEREGLRIVYQSWSTTIGKVVFENGQYTHPPARAEQESSNEHD